MENNNDIVKSYLLERRKKWTRYLTGIAVAVMTVITTYLVHTNPALNLADLTNTGVSGDLTSQLYMPKYEGGIGEEGLLEIKTKANIASFDSVTFALKYSPVDALEFENNPIVFDVDTVFQDAAFQMTASPQNGKLIVTVILGSPVSVAGVIPATELTHKTLFKLNTKLKSTLPEGQVIDVTFEDLAILDGVNPVVTPNMPASTITVKGQNELKVLNAAAIDSTHVAVTFSDLLSDIGNTVAYDFDPALTVNLVESGTGYGYDQKTVVLTTDPQTAGQEYSITVDPLSAINSNQQGSIDSNYSIVPFYGYGSGIGVLSDFSMVSATPTGYKTITVVFSHPVLEASVTKADFALSLQGGGPIIIDNVSSVNGNQVELAVATPLLKKNTYLLSEVSAGSILRASDSAQLGVNKVTLAGYKNGPRLIGAAVTSQAGPTYRLQLTFDETIQLGGVANNPVGRLFTTGTAAGTLIDDFNLGVYNQSISGTTLTLENAVFNDPDKNFTFAVSLTSYLKNSLGLSIDDTYKSISFWGLGHNNATNSIGTIQVQKKDAILVPKGTLDFNDVVLSDVSVLYDSGAVSLSTQTISSIGLKGNDLEVVMAGSLNPDRHYILRIVDNTISNTTLAAKDFAVNRTLSIASAQAVSATDVKVFFTENIDERNVDFTDFSINDGGIAVTGLTIDPGYQSVTLKTAGPLTASVIFKVTITGITDVYSYTGNAVLKNSAYFTGYGTLSAKSSVILQSVTVIDSQTLRMNFSGDIKETSFTPVNLNLFYFPNPADPSIRTALVVSSITKISSTVYELKTATQVPDKNYFTIFKGVEDATGLRLGNAKPLNFFGFSLPKASISLVTPSTLANDLEANVVVSGQNLNIVNEVRVGNTVMTIVSQSASSLVFKVPAGFKAELYNINLIDQANNSLVFKNALLVTVPKAGLTVHSSQSKSIPLNVPNDGVTSTKLWLLVEDPVGLASISSVVVDLSQVGGPGSVEMIKNTGTQPQYSQWFTYQTTIPTTVATRDEAYLLPVEVRKGNEVFKGTVSIRVTKDVNKSVAPVIDNVYVSPISVSPDATTPVKISAQVTDQDGAATISSVIADLGAMGIGFKQLTAIGEVTEGTELETRFYESEEFTIPKTTQLGTYKINVVASDTTGEKGTATLEFQVSTLVTGPKIDADISYISPRQSIPNDGKTAFSVHAFVSDPDGATDIMSVTANFKTLGIPPVVLLKDPSASTEGTSAWFQATGLTIPKTAPLGVHSVEIRATDKVGGISNLIIKLDVTHKDTLGDPPRVIEDRAYTTPRVATNDGEKLLTLYAFVQDDDDDIESVIVNLSEVGQVGPETGGTLGADASAPAVPSTGGCPTGSNVLVCMNPSVKEGTNGQWFILPGVTVSKTTASSPNPYRVEIVVTDKGGKTTRGTIPVYVGSGDMAGGQQEPPKALAAIPTSETTIEVLFNKELSANSVLASGKGFTVTGNGSTSDTLGVFGATINPSGNVVTLTTGNQIAGKAYVLSVSGSIKDLVGRSVQEGAANRLGFEGFKSVGRSPVIEYISATAVDTVEVEFRDNLKPSSVRMGSTDVSGGSQYGVKIYESDNTGNRLDVVGVTLLAPGNVIRVKTAPQRADMKYRINIEGLETYDGSKVLAPINKGFKGYNLGLAQHFAAANFADLNGDGKVDFADFTIFSSVYGTIYFGQGQNIEGSAANAVPQGIAAGQPITPNPDATVPITSEPDGGEIQ